MTHGVSGIRMLFSGTVAARRANAKVCVVHTFDEMATLITLDCLVGFVMRDTLLSSGHSESNMMPGIGKFVEAKV